MNAQTTKKQAADTGRREGDANQRFYAFARVVVGLIIPLVAKLRTEGLENVPKDGPVILASDHISWFDIPLVSIRIPRITHYMAKIELFGIPVLGGILRLLGAFSVRRGEGDREALRTAQRVLQEGELLIIFPEGHRSGGHLIEGKSGTALIALRAGVPVVPVAVFGTERILKGFRIGPFAPRVTVRYGKPFRLQPETGRYARDDVVNGINEIMLRIADLMPPEYRGIYKDGIPAPASAAPPEQVPSHE
jgi:1-acyl-sn-glycerol-3-phosphate acyltransferase